MAGGLKAPAGVILMVASAAEGREHRDVFPAKQCVSVNADPLKHRDLRFTTAYYTEAAMAASGERAATNWHFMRRHTARWDAPRIGRHVRILPIEQYELGEQ